MPVSFVDAFHINPELFDDTGAFNLVLDVDSKLFIDPALLAETSCPEFRDSKAEVEHFFKGIIVLLRHSENEGDRFWCAASKRLTFTEVKGTCLGYSEKGVAGNAIGPQLRERILSSVKELVDAGMEDPIIFELLGVFEKDVGCDRISDLLTYKLIDRICSYTARIMRECHFAGPVLDYRGYKLPSSPFNHDPILLLPCEILHPLPLAKRFEDIDLVCRENERVRDNVNRWFDFSDGANPTKSQIYRHLKDDCEFRDAFVSAYCDAHAEQYDFKTDAAGEVAWYEKGKRLASDNPICILAGAPSKESLESVVVAIVEQFKQVVECNGAWELLFKEDRKTPRSERSSQHLFSAIAMSYCVANNIDISPEVNSGNGPVDFKFSSGYSNKVLVELKLSKNSQLNHCIDKQIPIYMAQERTDKAIYLLINVGNDKKIEAFRVRYNGLDSSVRQKIPLVVVDAKPKVSASKA